MQSEEEKNRLRVLSVQQNVPLRISSPTQQQPQQLRVSTPYTPPTPAPRQTSFGQKAESFISGAGSQLGGGLLRSAFRIAPTVARFTPMGLTSYAAGKLGGRDVFAELQRKGEELAQESERRQAQEIARLPDQAMARRGMQFGSGIKGTAEAALTVLPAGAASKVAQASNLYRTGLRAASPAVRLGTRIAENVISGVPATVVSTFQEIGRGKTPNIAREALIGTLADAVIPVIGKVVNKGRQALKNVDVKNLFTKITEPNQIKEIINAVDKNLPESLVDDAAEALAKSSELEQVDSVLEDLIGERPIKPVVPEVPTARPTVTPAAGAAITQAVDATARQLAQTSDPTATKLAIDALFPNLDEATRTNLSNTIARTTDPETVKTSLEQAQKRSDELSATIAQETPPVQTETQRQAEAAARLVEQPPVVEAPVRPVTQTTTVTPTPSTVAEAVAPDKALAEAKSAFKQKSELERKYVGKKNLKLTEAEKAAIDKQYNELNKIVIDFYKQYGGFDTGTGFLKLVDKNGIDLYKPKVNIPVPVNSKTTFYHGTQGPINKISELDISYGNMDNLFGPGIYLTDNPNIASGYQTTRGTNVQAGKVLSGTISDAKLFNLENTLPKDLAELFRKEALRNTDYPNEIPDFSNLTGVDAIREIKKYVGDKYGFDDFFTQKVQPLLKEKGFDGFYHIGGVQGGEKHNVAILFEKTKLKDLPVVQPTKEVPAPTPTPSTVQGAGAGAGGVPPTAGTGGAGGVPPTGRVGGAAGAGGTPPTPPPSGQPKVSEVLYGTDSPSEEQGLDFIRRFSPNRLIREYVTRPAQDFVNRMFAKAQVSGVAPIRGLGRLGTGISRELGATPELLAARKQFLQGTGEFGKIVREDIVALGKGLSDTVQQRVWATLDPELAAAKGIKVSIADLQPEELAYRDELVKIRDAITQENLDRGLINEEQARANWFKRGYEVFDFEPEAKTAYQDTKRGLLKQFKGRKDISEELVEAAIEDPSYLLAKKAADSHAVWGMVDYGNWLAANDLVSDVARPGYRQLPTSKIYGEASGKFVPTNIAEDFTGFQFNNAITNAFNDVITAYDNLGVRKAKKAILTVLNPTVRLGNQLSNRVIFAQLGGINPFTFNKNFIRVKKLRASRDPLYLEAVKRGLTGLDMTQKEFTSKVAEYTGQPNLAQKAWEWAKGSYSQADDTARIAAFVTNVERGYSLDEAARLSQRAFQDYKSVGFLYDIAAKTPIVGNAFIRFAGDSARILTNALVDQPLTLAGSLTGLWALGEYMSRMSGETPDEKKTREERFGAPKVPFVNIPLEIQTPWGAVNAARFLPYYNLNEIQGNLTKFLPFAGNPLESKNWNDPLLGQALQILVDKDFRGKSIAEPENVGQFRTPTPSDTALENRVRFALTQNLPLGREVDALYSAAKGQEDVYGGERSLGQAIGRLFGVKVEKFGPEQVNKLKENEAFFADKKFIDDQLATMPKDLQEKYKKLTGYYKLRDQVENTFAKGKMRFKKEPVFAFPEDKYKELSSAPELYDLLMQQKIRDNQRDGKPIPPEFDIRLSNEFRRQLIENKSLRPGEDLEADERMFTNPEWDIYQAIKKEYTAKAKEFYPQTSGEFNDELVKHQNADFPEKGGAYKEYSDAYALFAKGQGPKPTFTDAVAVDKEKYNQAKLDWVNKERKARGLAPISPEVWNNVTFGFTSDEEKVYNELRYGRGLGGFGFSSTSPEYKAAMAALQQAGITVKPLEIVSAAPRRVRLQRQRVPTSRRTARIRLR